MGKRKVIFQLLLFHFDIITGRSGDVAATMSVQYEPGINNIMFNTVIYADQYQLFQSAFLTANIDAIYLYYAWNNTANMYYINLIWWSKDSNFGGNFYFKCYHMRDLETIVCYRHAICSTISEGCINGFSICWEDGEYLSSIHLQNSSVNCRNRNILTCYKLNNQHHSSTTAFLSTSTPSIGVNTHLNVSLITTTKEYTDQISSFSLTTIPLSTIHQVTGPLNSTLLSVEHKPSSSSAVSTTVIAGVTVSIVIVIVIVILIVVIFRKRQRHKESTNNTELPTVNLETNLYKNQQDPSFNQRANSNFTVHILSNKKCSATNPIPDSNIENTSDKTNTVYAIAQPISESDYTCIEDGEGPTSTSRSLSVDKESYDYYYTTVDNLDSAVTRPVARDTKGESHAIEEKHSVVNKVHPVSPQPEYATVNENVGYKNFMKNEHIKTLAAEHEYNNVKQDNALIGESEPVKNVYSKLRENFRHFAHTYGDVCVSEDEIEVK